MATACEGTFENQHGRHLQRLAGHTYEADYLTRAFVKQSQMLVLLNVMAKANGVKVSNKQQLSAHNCSQTHGFRCHCTDIENATETPTVVGVEMVGLLPKRSYHIC